MEESLFFFFDLYTLIAFVFYFVALAWVRIQHIYKGKNYGGAKVRE